MLERSTVPTKKYSACRQVFEISALLGAYGKSDLVFIEGMKDSNAYCKVLEEGFVPMIDKFGEDFWARIYFSRGWRYYHTSKYTQKWKNRRGIRLLNAWHPKSPDINPIENLWHLVQRSLLRKLT